MTQPQKNTALAIAIVAGLVSLPMTWMTLRDVTLQGPIGNMFNPMFSSMTVDLTGLNGHVTLLVKTPLWFIVTVAIAANVLQLMRNSRMFAIPRAAEWFTAIAATGWILVAVLTGLFSSSATLGMGSLLGLASAVIPLVCLACRTAPGISAAVPSVNESEV